MTTDQDEGCYEMIARESEDLASAALEYAEVRPEGASLYQFVISAVAEKVGYAKVDGKWVKSSETSP